MVATLAGAMHHRFFIFITDRDSSRNKNHSCSRAEHEGGRKNTRVWFEARRGGT